MTSSSIHLLKPSFPPKTLPRFSPSVFTPFNLQLRPRRRNCLSIGSKSLNIQACKSGSTSTSNSNSVNDETESAQQLFEKLKEAERERINKLEEFERKANVQLERQLLLASEWSRKLLAMQGKLKGTEWDPENSHKIDYSQFQNLLNANNVQFMEYSNYGQTVSVILPYYKDGKTKGSGGENRKDIVFKRHVVDRMPIDCWNDVWRKLHQQLVNVDVYNVNNIPAEVYSTVATAVVWSMRLALSVVLYIWIDNKMRPIYSKLIPCDLGSAPKKISEPQKQRALGSLGKSRCLPVWLLHV